VNHDHARQSDAAAPGPIRVLFLCTHNSARSQIAEALLQRAGGPAFEVESAGTQATRVNPFAVRVLAEVGIDWSAASSKVLDDFVRRRFDYVITVCDSARQACPFFPNAEHRLHWGLEDPSEVEGADEERLEAFRRTRAELEARLRSFVAEALAPAGRPGSATAR
jgi:arsenate reductase